MFSIIKDISRIFFQFLVPTMPEGWLTKLSKELNSPFNYTFKDRLRLIGGPQRSSAYISGKTGFCYSDICNSISNAICIIN